MRSTIPLALALSLATTPVYAAGGGEGSKSQSRLTSAESFLPLPPLLSATPAGRSIGGMMTVELGLDVPDPKLRERAKMMKPRVQDALRSAISDYTLTYLAPGAAPDPEQISRLAQQALDRALGQPGARVLLSNVMLTDRR
jgi:flagellar basal body-associated protein FliL